MATQFDAVARLSVDLRGFASASRTMTQQGGTMQKVFRDLHNVLNQVDIVEKQLAGDLRRTLGVYSAIASSATKYAQAVKALAASEATAANGAANMAKAFGQLNTALSSITGLGEREAARLQRTLGLYNQMASALLKVNQATALAAKTTQQAAQADQQRVLTSQRIAAATTNAQAAQARLNQQLERQRVLTQQAAAAQQQYTSALGGSGRLTLALRSDLSELEQLYRKLATVISASATAAVNAAISHEASFAQVLRVTQETGAGADDMRRSFEKLTTQLPVSFEELSKIGQLAAQTGVANDQLVAFSRTVVQFSVTTGIASDQVTVLFARIADMLNLPTNQMNNFASTILKLGTISAATEAEILKVTQSIASSARAFGLSTEEVAGLSGALASLRIPPEWSRGSATRIFRDLDNAANKAGMGMNVLVEVLGMSAKEITNLRRTDPGEFFQKFIQGMQKFTREGQLAAGTTRTITDVLGDLDIKAVRDIDFVTRLANNFGTLKTQTNEAFLEFARGTELTKQTEVVFGTTRQNIDNMKDAFQTFLASAGKPFAATMGAIAEVITDAIEAFQDFNPAVKTSFSVLAGVVSVAAALAAGIALYRMALIRTARSIIAFSQVQRDMNGQALNGRNVMGLYREQQERTRQALAGTAATLQQTAAAQREFNSVGAQSSRNAVAAREALAAQSVSARVAAEVTRQNAASVNTLTSAQRAQNTVSQNAFRNASILAEANRRMVPIYSALAQAQRNGQSTTQGLVAAQQAQNSIQNSIRASTAQTTAAMYNAATAARQSGREFRASGAAATGAATGYQAAGAGAVVAGAAARGAAVGVGLFKAALTTIGIGVIITGLTALVAAFTSSKTASSEAAKAGYEAAGGMTSLGEAIAKDTAAVNAGILPAFATLTSSVKDLDKADRDRLNTILERAQAEQGSIRLVGSSVEALREQAKGTGAAAEQAKNYVKRWEAAQAAIDSANKELSGNTRYLSENSQALVRNAVEQSLMKDEASKNVDALKKLEAIAPAVNRAIDLAFKDPTKAAQILKDEVQLVEAELRALNNLPQRSVSGEEIDRRNEQKKDLKDQISLINTIGKSIGLQNDEVRKADISYRIFGKNAKAAAEDVAAGADEALNGITDVAGATDDLATEMKEAENRASTLSSALQAVGGFASAYAKATAEAQKEQDAANKITDEASAKAEKLRDAQDKLNNTLGDIKTDSTEKLREAQTKLSQALADAGGNAQKAKAAQDDYDRSIRAIGESSSKTTKAYGDYNTALKDIETESSKTAKSTDEVTASFEKLMKFLASEGQARLERTSNLIKLAARVPADVIKELEALGPEYSQFIATLTTKSDAELAKMIPSFRLNGKASADAMGQGLTDSLPSLEGKGAAAGDVASAAFAKAVREAVEGDGDITKAVKQVSEGIKLADELKIPIDVAIDIVKAEGKVNELQFVIDRAEAEGKLTADVAVDLKEKVFLNALEEIRKRIKGTNLDPIEGKVVLNPEQYDREKKALEESAEVATLLNLIGIDGFASLDSDKWNQVRGALEKLGIEVTQGNRIGMSGKATLTEEEYMKTFRQMERDSINRGNAISLKGTVSLDPKPYNDTLYGNNGIIAASYRAGVQISNNLSTSATVTVGYTYKNNNQPPNPNQYMNAARGGWVSGPGGPRDDRIRANLSNGEFVVNAKAAKQYGSLLQSINDFGLGGQRGLHIPAIAGDPVTTGRLARSRPFDQTMPSRQYQSLRREPRTVITVNNSYPQAEPTSVTVNRSLAYSAMLDGTI